LNPPDAGKENPDMAVVCSWVVKVFILAYVVALVLFLVGIFGWFGSPKGPLVGVFLVPLGLPWNQLLGSAPDTFRPWLAVATPLANIAILKAICARLPAKGD
jgi:hypothetical protein